MLSAGHRRLAQHDGRARIATSRRTGRSFRTASIPTSFIRARLRRRESTNDVPTILFLGRFDPRNGLTTLIDSFRRVKAKGNRGRQARLVVVGDGPLREHYYKQANGDQDIAFVGAVLEGRPSYYAHSSVYACPTTKASFGITLLESMACETPVVCSDILGFRDVVVDGREALMVPCGDRDALADALVRVLDDEGLAIQLGTTGPSEFARILVGACHVSRARRVSERSRKRRRRRYDARPWRRRRRDRRRRARRVSPQQSASSAGRSRRLRDARPRRRAHVRRRPESRRDAARFSTRSRERGVKATFFILGRHAERWPELVRARRRRRTRDRQSRLLPSQAALQVARVRSRRSRARHRRDRARVGRRARALSRAARLSQPVGDARSRASLGQRTVGWSLGVWDSDRPGVDAIARRTVEGARPGSILLLHDGDGYDPRGDRMQTAQAVPLIVDRLLDQGYRFDLLDAA